LKLDISWNERNPDFNLVYKLIDSSLEENNKYLSQKFWLWGNLLIYIFISLVTLDFDLIEKPELS
jgi:hypothetical protein